MGKSKTLDWFHESLNLQSRETHEELKKRSVTARVDELQFYYIERIAKKLGITKSACATNFVVSALDEIMDDLDCDEEWFADFVEMKKAAAEKEAA